jgi:nucleoside-diphosphate-sugar epimerase
VGCGYVGRRLASRLGGHHDITALVRSDTSAAVLQRQGIRTACLDLDRPGSRMAQWPAPEALIYLVPPPRQGESDQRLDRFLRLAGAPPACFVYLSTTGVYGDAQGELVDESTPVRPRNDRARRRVSAEEMTRVWCSERHVRRVVLRVPGIYGPGRLPLELLRRSEPLVYEQEAGIGNRIHVDDLVEACAAALSNPLARGVYNVTDGNALSSTAFVRQVAKLAGLPSPPQVSMDEAQLTFSPERLSFLNESRRVCNRRMLEHLGVTLKYADLERGIRASLEAH